MWQYLIVLVVSLYILNWFKKKFSSSMPGYDGVPVLGVVPFLDVNPAVTFMEWSKKLGPVFRVKMGMQDAIVLNDYESIVKCLSENGQFTSDRPTIGILDGVRRGHGFGFQCFGSAYKSNKKIVVSSLKMFVGDLESRIHNEIEVLFKRIDSHNGKGFNVKPAISNIYASVICHFMIGKRLGWGHKTITELLETMNGMFNNPKDNNYIIFLQLFDGFKYIPPFTGVYRRYQNCLSRQKEIFIEIIDEHRQSRDKAIIRDVIDLFLSKQEKDPNNPIYMDEELVFNLVDMFDAGVDTTSACTMWLLLYLVGNKEVQEKIHQEIQNAFGSGKPTYSLKDDLPYTLSFIDETSRHRTMFPLSVLHKTNGKFQLSDKVNVLNKTMIIPNLWAIHKNSKYFEDPYKMVPDRFVDKNSGKFLKSPHVIQFGKGFRKCVGYQLAEKEIFLVLCSIVQKYRITKDLHSTLPDFNDGVPGFIYFPKAFNVCFEKRQQC